MEKPLEGRRVVMVIASQDFRDEEYVKPRQILEKEGARVTLASSRLGPVRGMLGMAAIPEVLLKDVQSTQYDAVVFVGGMGATEYWTDPAAHKLAREFADKGKVTAAICIAPVILANAGLLKDRSATAWSSSLKELEAKGARVETAPVVTDGIIVTGNGPEAAEEFGRALVKALSLAKK